MRRSRGVALLISFCLQQSAWSIDWLENTLKEISQSPDVQEIFKKAVLPSDHVLSEQEAKKGFLEPLKNHGIIHALDGRVIFEANKFRPPNANERPSTVHPSLWHHSMMLANQGLFKVADRIYQIRGLDLANITFVIGDTGITVIDPLTCQETARAALERCGARGWPVP